MRELRKVVLFGASGMVGQGVLRECWLDPQISEVVSIVRSSTGEHDAKVREVAIQNFYNFSGIENELSGVNACFFCLGISSAGMTEERYRHITYDITLAAARTLAKLNPDMTFIYVSGMGTDSTERGRSMWARVKGQTENDLLRLPIQAYAFRPGMIVPMHGARSKTRVYRWLYAALTPLLPLLNSLFPKHVTTTEQIGRAMIHVATQGAPKKILETADINAISQLSETA
ncbi:MAG TPA: hypothetical protein VN862_09850 [Candidatus Acidoferrales bacterium]|nr:hypothetical protein [Candidatus Acidoferrales bacterium]